MLKGSSPAMRKADDDFQEGCHLGNLASPARFRTAATRCHTRASSPLDWYSCKNVRLLLVEDDAMIGEAIRTGLKRDGFTVYCVHDGESAEQVLRTNAFDLLLLDLGLPRKGGLQVLQGLRARQQTLPVLIITARDAVSDRVQGL